MDSSYPGATGRMAGARWPLRSPARRSCSPVPRRKQNTSRRATAELLLVNLEHPGHRLKVSFATLTECGDTPFASRTLETCKRLSGSSATDSGRLVRSKAAAAPA